MNQNEEKAKLHVCESTGLKSQKQHQNSLSTNLKLALVQTIFFLKKRISIFLLPLCLVENEPIWKTKQNEIKTIICVCVFTEF